MSKIIAKKPKVYKNGIYHLFMVLILLIITSCNKKTPSEPEIELPPLNDPIPYDTLLSGTIVFERIGPYPGEYDGCYVIDIDRRKTWALDLGSTNRSSYCVSPNGEKIAFTMYSDIKTLFDVYIVDIDGTNLVRLAALEGQDRYPSWTPDSKKVLFWVANRPTLYMKSHDADSDDLVKIMELLQHPPSGRFSVSIDNKITYVSNLYWRGHNITGLYIMNMDGINRELLVPLPDNRVFESPEFSPDGQKIAFLSVLGDSTFNYKKVDLFLVERNGANLHSIATFEAKGEEWAINGKTYGVSLAWSPDGSKLLFNLPEGDFISHLYLINSDGTGLTQVTSADGVTDRCVSWSD